MKLSSKHAKLYAMDKNKAPLVVSVVLTCYNYAQYVADAIISIVNQSYGSINLIVINDGSTDNSDTVIKKLQKEYKFEYISGKNKGVIDVRNQGIQVAAGEYLMFLDADDTLPDNYVSSMVKVAEQTGADVVYADYKMFGDASFASNFPEFSLDELKNHNFISISALIRKSAIGGTQFDQKLSGKTHEDWDFFLSLAVRGAKFVKCSETQLNYRIHDGARNNRLEDVQSRRSYIDIYTYIIRKHVEKNKDEFEYLSGYIFGEWYKVLDDLRSEELAGQKEKIAALANENRQIKSSLSWKITAPLRYANYVVRHILNRKDKHAS